MLIAVCCNAIWEMCTRAHTQKTKRMKKMNEFFFIISRRNLSWYQALKVIKFQKKMNVCGINKQIQIFICRYLFCWSFVFLEFFQCNQKENIKNSVLGMWYVCICILYKWSNDWWGGWVKIEHNLAKFLFRWIQTICTHHLF